MHPIDIAYDWARSHLAVVPSEQAPAQKIFAVGKGRGTSMMVRFTKRPYLRPRRIIIRINWRDRA